MVKGADKDNQSLPNTIAHVLPFLFLIEYRLNINSVSPVPPT